MASKSKDNWYFMLVICVLLGFLWFQSVPQKSEALPQRLTYATSSYEKSNSSEFSYTGMAAITSVQVITDGTNAATLIIYDNTAASGNKVAELKCDGDAFYCGWTWNYPVLCGTGITGDVSGTGSSYIIEYLY